MKEAPFHIVFIENIKPSSLHMKKAYDEFIISNQFKNFSFKPDLLIREDSSDLLKFNEYLVFVMRPWLNLVLRQPLVTNFD